MTPSEKDTVFLTQWETHRAKGRWRYAFKIGVLFWAIPVYVFLQLFYYLFRDNYTFEISKFMIGLLFWMVMGFFGFGLITWWLNEKRFAKLKAQNPEE